MSGYPKSCVMWGKSCPPRNVACTVDFHTLKLAGAKREVPFMQGISGPHLAQLQAIPIAHEVTVLIKGLPLLLWKMGGGLLCPDLRCLLPFNPLPAGAAPPAVERGDSCGRIWMKANARCQYNHCRNLTGRRQSPRPLLRAKSSEKQPNLAIGEDSSVQQKRAPCPRSPEAVAPQSMLGRQCGRRRDLGVDFSCQTLRL
ncbi:PREDICTED: uncharacterized protein LOC102018726 isoform X2 [Chinchilla lanigera]|uniref:uncharacterized protein LOC102018726 isoform X2 n=1 Tax=Chinchilla lanigera TaxID=34839 RepID=UPI000696D05B|nr:PREDICTED: uncharacterized protein LOC102018726 isoform X2 [Chinchilla lanigera]